MIIGRMCTNVLSSFDEEVLIFQFGLKHILILYNSCICGTSLFDKEVPEFLKYYVLV